MPLYKKRIGTPGHYRYIYSDPKVRERKAKEEKERNSMSKEEEIKQRLRGLNNTLKRMEKKGKQNSVDYKIVEKLISDTKKYAKKHKIKI